MIATWLTLWDFSYLYSSALVRLFCLSINACFYINRFYQPSENGKVLEEAQSTIAEQKSRPHYQCSVAFFTKIRALFTKARISSSNALRSGSGTFWSFLRAANDLSKSDLPISTSSSWVTDGDATADVWVVT